MKISIVTPSFNQAHFIEKTIQSILAQQGEFEIEYIVMDGGSTDGTIDILKRYDGQIIWKSEPDKGQSDAINKGLKLATGDVVAYLNSDDTYKPDAFARVIHHFTSNPESMWVCGKCDIMDLEENEIRHSITKYKNYWLDKMSKYWFFVENYISQPAVFWRKAALEKVGFFDENHHMVMDYHYWCRLWTHFTPGYIDHYLASFRWYETSKSGSTYHQQFLDQLAVAKEYSPYKSALWIHYLNSYKIIIAYKLMGLARKIFKPSRSA